MIPTSLARNLRFPAIAAPMFLVSGPELVISTCKAGMIGTFPALNQRTTEGYEDWLNTIEAALGDQDASFGVNMIVHPTNSRLLADMQVTVKHKVPLVITSLGAVKDVVDAVHGYGGVVFHDIINARHARKAMEAGVDGLILVSAGAGGHAGNQHPFALLNEVRQFFKGTIILSGALSTGQDVAAALMAGADLGYMGTRFIATTEAQADPGYKQMLIDTTAKDITYTDAISGINANFLTPSLVANGLDPTAAKDPHHKIDMDEELNPEAKAWKTIWSAGQGVGSIHEVLPVAELVSRLQQEFNSAAQVFASKARDFN
ncbi:2-nitropropane dioxygenase family protein [Asticcacaulis biprosthecium C19]|uniref:2-nitropropane dioxygenase family protein n=1 Tax=Asticcacaulis biprosthecium C19 TaxID=715226 RepID=F4QU56_9CAUL|nr:nitronate monooxygenase [Asticcacaulis biprosthecium]EGF89356.1 2-nitropropane dioxygenase family protein [Asticcacaulis biprosthecium C19]